MKKPKRVEVFSMELPYTDGRFWGVNPYWLAHMAVDKWMTTEESLYLQDKSRSSLKVTEEIDSCTKRLNIKVYAMIDEQTQMMWKLKF